MDDADVADLARRLVAERGGALSAMDVYRLHMLLPGTPAPLTEAALAGVPVHGDPVL
jgi:hypothetical protein